MRKISKKREEMGEEAWAEYQIWRLRKKEEISRKRRADHVVNWRKRTKQKLIIYKGGKCEKCGYDNISSPSSFHFHHPDPDQKDFSISAKSASYQVMQKEVDKCKLYCANCHGEIHDEINDKKRQRTIERYRMEIQEIEKDGYELFQKRTSGGIILSKQVCSQCGIEFKPRNNYQKYCSQKCSRMVSRRVLVRPSKEELEEMLSTMTYVAIGKKYRISDSAVRKWARGYSII